jgi:hypothetical protein
MNKLENIGFIIKAILTIVDLALPNHKMNLLANDEKRAFIVMIMDECHKIYRLNIPSISNINSPINSNINSNINIKEGNNGCN